MNREDGKKIMLHVFFKTDHCDDNIFYWLNLFPHSEIICDSFKIINQKAQNQLFFLFYPMLIAES